MLTVTYESVRTGIVAFAPKYPELVLQDECEAPHLRLIFGTGFIIDDSLIATNQHVIEDFNRWPKPEGAPKEEIPVVAVYFTKVGGGFGVCLLNVRLSSYIERIEGVEVDYRTKLPDVAIVAVDCRGLQRDALTLEVEPTPSGTEVATAGFPMGSTLLAPYGQLERFGAVLQRGIVSAEAPFYGAEPHAYLIDVMIQGGASGSPVFRVDDGKVIGVINASQPDEAVASGPEIQISIPLPTSFSYVVPATAIQLLKEKARERLLKAVSDDAPSIEDIVASMPKNPVAKVTTGSYSRPPAAPPSEENIEAAEG